jgi:hypothetical protein
MNSKYLLSNVHKLKSFLKKSALICGRKKILYLILGLSLAACKAQGNLKIPSSNPIKVDGILDHNEWQNAIKNTIVINEGWKIPIYYQQDKNHLYFAFSNLKPNDSTELYPEVLIDSQYDRTLKWDENDWWFHTSYSNCEGKGKYNNYSTCKKGEKEGWVGNNFPISNGGVVEIKISKKLINVTKGATIGLAFNVTDTQKNWYFYPKNAVMETPKTWFPVSL